MAKKSLIIFPQRKFRFKKTYVLLLCFFLMAFIIKPCFSWETKKGLTPNNKPKLLLDLGYLTPLGLEAGIGVIIPQGITPYTQFGFGISGMTPEGQEKWGKGRFATWALGLRFRIPKAHFKSRFTNYFTLGYLARDFYAISGGNALESLYSTDWSDQLEIPFNHYITLGYRFGLAYLSLEFRISDFKGCYTASGYDPYGVAASWSNKIDDVCPPRVILILAARFDWPIPSGGEKANALKKVKRQKESLPSAEEEKEEVEKTVWVKVRSANIRDGPSTQNKVIAGAKWNDKLLVIEEQGKWYKVELLDGAVGWIYKPLCSSDKLKVKPIIESDRQQERLFPASHKDGYCDHCGKKLSAWESFYYSMPNMELCKECYKEMEALIEMMDR